MQSFNIHPISLIKALSMALELAVNGMSKHHWRTAVICKNISDRLKMDNFEQQRLLYAALLHDIGAASSWDERRKVKSVESFAVGVYKHAEDGYFLLKDSARLGELAEPIRYHHDKWAGNNPSGLSGDAIPLTARLIHLADRIEVLINEQERIFLQRERISKKIISKSGTDFDPKLVDVFKECAESESFWLDLVNINYYDTFFKGLDIYGAINYSLDDAINIAEIFAIIIDRMSSFTANHSRSVAKMASFIAKLKGFSVDEVKNIQIAGLLHDLGKLSIPNEILEKPGALTHEEVMIIRQHTYYTYRILEQIDNFDTIKEWAAYHHECLDGSGYPFKLKEESISLGSRIVAVADVFVALTEDRPYRSRLPEDRVKSIMYGMVEKHKLDRQVTKELLQVYQEAIKLMTESI